VVAYLGTGEVLGELALLTGSPRSATVRSPEHAELFSVDKAVFFDLLDILPAFSRNLCVVLAKRLETTPSRSPGHRESSSRATCSTSTSPPSSRRSSGRTRRAPWWSTRTSTSWPRSSSSAGTSRAHATASWPGKMRCSSSSRAGRRRLLVHRPRGARGRGPLRDFVARDLPSDGVGPLQDELPLLKERVPDPARVFRHKAAHLSWEEADTLELAAAVWSRLKKGRAWTTFSARCPARRTRSTGRWSPCWTRARSSRARSDPRGLSQLLSELLPLGPCLLELARDPGDRAPLREERPVRPLQQQAETRRCRARS